MISFTSFQPTPGSPSSVRLLHGEDIATGPKFHPTAGCLPGETLVGQHLLWHVEVSTHTRDASRVRCSLAVKTSRVGRYFGVPTRILFQPKPGIAPGRKAIFVSTTRRRSGSFNPHPDCSRAKPKSRRDTHRCSSTPGPTPAWDDSRVGPRHDWRHRRLRPTVSTQRPGSLPGQNERTIARIAVWSVVFQPTQITPSGSVGYSRWRRRPRRSQALPRRTIRRTRRTPGRPRHSRSPAPR